MPFTPAQDSTHDKLSNILLNYSSSGGETVCEYGNYPIQPSMCESTRDVILDSYKSLRSSSKSLRLYAIYKLMLCITGIQSSTDI
jgi:hypothetical protein